MGADMGGLPICFLPLGLLVGPGKHFDQRYSSIQRVVFIRLLFFSMLRPSFIVGFVFPSSQPSDQVFQRETYSHPGSQWVVFFCAVLFILLYRQY
ncbi:hypothetical protein B0H63DRAFT_317592 [Podospora didyma]|uniref:Uncharacterized protein n=1 Tax=Podospora didyma TaxID=330526 RepID=A0AAE0K5K0_9PEZI|nr:hypothetical protein B0H63DRAFT_317592 [Podospora didyma]